MIKKEYGCECWNCRGSRLSIFFLQPAILEGAASNVVYLYCWRETFHHTGDVHGNDSNAFWDLHHSTNRKSRSFHFSLCSIIASPQKKSIPNRHNQHTCMTKSHRSAWNLETSQKMPRIQLVQGRSNTTHSESSQNPCRTYLWGPFGEIIGIRRLTQGVKGTHFGSQCSVIPKITRVPMVKVRQSIWYAKISEVPTNDW